MSDSFFSHHKYFMEEFSKINPFISKVSLNSYGTENREYKSEIKSPIKLYYSLFEDSSYINGVNNISLKNKTDRIKEKTKEINTMLNKEAIELKNIHQIRIGVDEIKKILNVDTNGVTYDMYRDQYVMMKKDKEKIELLVINHDKYYSIKNELEMTAYFLNELSKTLNIDFGMKYSHEIFKENKIITLSKEYKLDWYKSIFCKNNRDTSYIEMPIINGTCDLEEDYNIYENNSKK